MPIPTQPVNATVLFERCTAQYTLRIVRYASHRHMASHAHDVDGVSIILDGSLVEEAEHSSVTASAGWTVLKPAGTYHADRFGPSGATLLALELPGELGCVLPRRWQWSNRAAVFRAVLRLIRDARVESPDRFRGQAMTELAASLADRPIHPTEMAWLGTVKDTLDDPTATAPCVETLASHAGVHPVYLARKFRGAFGVSMREYRKIMQVRRAIQLIIGTNRSLSGIAHTCGFFDHSHMCRSFRVVARLHPSALRN